MTTTDRFIVTLLGVGAIAALGYLATPLVPAPDLHPLRSKLVELGISALSAVGTVAAAGAAVFFGLAPLREQRQEKKMRAQLMAAKLIFRVRALHHTVRFALLPLDFADDDDVVALGKAFKALARLDDQSLSFSDEELLTLMPLPGHAGPRLAYCASALHTIKQRSTPENVPPGKRYAKRWIERLEDIESKLSVVVAELEKASAVAAPSAAAEVLQREFEL